MTFLYEKSFEYHQSITKMDEMRRKGKILVVLLPTKSRLYSLVKGSMVVIPTDAWRRGGSNPLPQRCQRCALPVELRPQKLEKAG